MREGVLPEGRVRVMETCRTRKHARAGAVSDHDMLLGESTNEFTDIIFMATVEDTVLAKHPSGDARKVFDKAKDEMIIRG